MWLSKRVRRSSKKGRLLTLAASTLIAWTVTVNWATALVRILSLQEIGKQAKKSKLSNLRTRTSLSEWILACAASSNETTVKAQSCQECARWMCSQGTTTWCSTSHTWQSTAFIRSRVRPNRWCKILRHPKANKKWQRSWRCLRSGRNWNLRGWVTSSSPISAEWESGNRTRKAPNKSYMTDWKSS